MADRAGNGWGEPRPLDQTVNALPQHWQFAVDKDGGVYFSSNWKGARGLFYSPWANGRHAEAVPLGASINANGSEGMPFVAKDGSYLLFSRDMDIWVSFRGPDGAWKAPVRLPSPINTRRPGDLPDRLARRPLPVLPARRADVGRRRRHRDTADEPGRRGRGGSGTTFSLIQFSVRFSKRTRRFVSVSIGVWPHRGMTATAKSLFPLSAM